MKTTNILHFLIAAGLLTTILACQSTDKAPWQKIDDPQVREVLACALDQCGSWEKFSQLKKIAYTKRSVLLDSLGNVESDLTEHHDFSFGKMPRFELSSRSNAGNSTVYLMENGVCKKWINGAEVEADSQEVIKKVNTALYTLLMPWKLLDEGTRLEYAGIDTLPGGLSCHVLEARYPEGEPWRYYFDEENCKYRAAWASHGPFGALVMNDSTVNLSGITLNARRTTWRTWEKQKPLWRRALFFYDDFSLSFE